VQVNVPLSDVFGCPRNLLDRWYQLEPQSPKVLLSNPNDDAMIASNTTALSDPNPNGLTAS